MIIVFTSIPCFDGKSNSVALSFQPVVIIFQEPLLSSLRRLMNTFASISAYTLQLPVQWVLQKLGPRRLRGQLVLKNTVYIHCNSTWCFLNDWLTRSSPRMRLWSFSEIVARDLISFKGKLNFWKKWKIIFFKSRSKTSRSFICQECMRNCCYIS